MFHTPKKARSDQPGQRGPANQGGIRGLMQALGIQDEEGFLRNLDVLAREKGSPEGQAAIAKEIKEWLDDGESKDDAITVQFPPEGEVKDDATDEEPTKMELLTFDSSARVQTLWEFHCDVCHAGFLTWAGFEGDFQACGKDGCRGNTRNTTRAFTLVKHSQD